MADNWYSTGLAGQQKFKEMEALRQITSKQNNVRRFKLKPGDKAKIIFLENPNTWLYEHSVNVEGRWENFTCTADRETCPLCQTGNKQSAILVTTIIDTRKSVSSKTGKEYKNQKALLVLKGKAIRAIMRQFLEGNKVDLTHYSMEIERDIDKQSVACGEFLTLGKKLSVQALEAAAKQQDIDPKEYLKPFDYFSILAPKEDRELQLIAGIRAPIGSDESTDLDELGLGGLDTETSAADVDFLDTSEEEESIVEEDAFEEEDEEPPFDTGDKKPDKNTADAEEALI
jgi:hypothetical protein